MKLKIGLIAAAAASTTLSIAVPVTTANAATTLRYAEFSPNRGWRAAVHKWMVKELEKRSKGQIKVRVSWGGSLIKARAVLRGVGSGLADMGTIVGVYTPKQLENFRVGDIPTGNDDPWVGLRAMYDVATKNPTVKAEFDKQNVVYLGNFTSSTILLSCKRPITKLSDLKGLKVRANPPHSEVFKKFGAIIVSMPFPEIYQALDKGIIECAQTYWVAIYAYKHTEVAKHITALKWSQNMGFGMIMNRNKFNRMSPAHQKLMRDLGRDMTEVVAKVTIGSTAKLKQLITKDKSVQVHSLDTASQKELATATAEAGKLFKGDPSVLKDYLTAVDKYEAERKAKGYPWARK